MNDEKWESVKDNIKERFEVLDEKIEDIIYDDPITNKSKKIGQREVLEFSSPLGEMKVSREKRLLIEDKKHYYHKTKTDAAVQFVFKENEYGDNIKVFKKDGEEWVEIKGEGLLV